MRPVVGGQRLASVAGGWGWPLAVARRPGWCKGPVYGLPGYRVTTRVTGLPGCRVRAALNHGWYRVTGSGPRPKRAGLPGCWVRIFLLKGTMIFFFIFLLPELPLEDVMLRAELTNLPLGDVLFVDHLPNPPLGDVLLVA